MQSCTSKTNLEKKNLSLREIDLRACTGTWCASEIGGMLSTCQSGKNDRQPLELMCALLNLSFEGRALKTYNTDDSEKNSVMLSTGTTIPNWCSYYHKYDFLGTGLSDRLM